MSGALANEEQGGKLAIGDGTYVQAWDHILKEIGNDDLDGTCWGAIRADLLL